MITFFYSDVQHVGFHDTKRREKLKFYHKPEPRIHVIRLTDLIKVSKTLPQKQVKARLLEGREGIHTCDTLPRAFFSFFDRLKMSPKGCVLYWYLHE